MGIAEARKWENKTVMDITGNIIIEIIKGDDELYQKAKILTRKILSRRKVVTL